MSRPPYKAPCAGVGTFDPRATLCGNCERVPAAGETPASHHFLAPAVRKAWPRDMGPLWTCANYISKGVDIDAAHSRSA